MPAIRARVGDLWLVAFCACLCGCSGGSHSSASSGASTTQAGAPKVSLSASPTAVTSGGSSALSWSSNNASGCSASGGWSGNLASSGSQTVSGIATTTTYDLSCTGADGSGSASVTVTVAPAGGMSPAVAAVTPAQTQQFVLTTNDPSASWNVDGVAGGNATVGTVSAQGLYTPGSQPGAHTVMASSSGGADPASATIAVTDLTGVYTHHGDLARDGANTHEFALTPATVTGGTFGKLFSCRVDGAIYAQPLWAAGVHINGALRNVVFVATAHDGLFAFDADASPCQLLWSVSLIDGNHGGSAGEQAVPYTLLGTATGDIMPEVGVIGTPVIDPQSGTLYVVSKSVSADQSSFYQRLHAIDIISGAERAGSPALISATFPGTADGGATVSFNARFQSERAALAFVNGVVYIAWASHEDQAPYYGWVIGYHYNGSGFTQSAVLNVTPNVRYGGIWMGGGGPAADANGNLYLITGNGVFDANSASPPTQDYGDSLLRLTAGLTIADYFTPSDQDSDNLNDDDFGSGGTAVLADLTGSPVVHVVIGGGKDGTLYVLNRDQLGGMGDVSAIQRISTNSQILSSPAFWNNTVYNNAVDKPLTAWQLNAAGSAFTSAGSSAILFGYPSSTPTISAQGTQDGIVWMLDNSTFCTNWWNQPGCGPAVLHAFDASNVANELWNSAQHAGDAAGYPVKFSVPTVANGKVYVGTRGNNTGGADGSSSIPGELDVYGFK